MHDSIAPSPATSTPGHYAEDFSRKPAITGLTNLVPSPAQVNDHSAKVTRQLRGDEPRVADAIGEMFMGEDTKERRDFIFKATEAFQDLLSDVAADFVAARETPWCAKYDGPASRVAKMLERVARQCGVVKDPDDEVEHGERRDGLS